MSTTTLSDNLDDYCFLDTETKALPHTRGTTDESVVTSGAYRYRRGARVVMIQHAIGLAKPTVSAFPDFDITRKFMWSPGRIPDDLWTFHQRALRGEAWYAAWNMNFDRLMLNTIDGCEIRPDMTIDVMAQGLASNSPGTLEGASRFVGRHGKQQDGKNLIGLFSNADGWHDLTTFVPGGVEHRWVGDPGATPNSHYPEWQRFKSYGAQDIDELRAVFLATRQLPRREWEEYWTSERINDRGMGVDVDFCYRADLIAEANKRRLGIQIKALTGGKITAPTQRERIANWLYDNCPSPEARDTLVKVWADTEDGAEDDDQLVPAKLSVAEDNLNKYLTFYRNLDEAEGLTDEEFDLLQIAEARSFGASATPAKFGKIVDQHDEGRLKGQYRFNGAQQTGRFCVDAHTLVDTPYGLRYIVDLLPSDYVISHRGRACPVEALIYKGRETMYRVIGPEGAFVDATLGHRLLTEKGWLRLDECFQIPHEGHGALRPSCEPISLARDEHDPDRRIRLTPRAHCVRYLATGANTGGAQALAWSLPFAREDGRGEPDVRAEDGSGEDTAARARSSLERRGLHLRAPYLGGEVAGAGGAAGALGGAPHRRGQDEQRSGQPGGSDEARASRAAQEETWALVCLGERDVWDISVRGDASYIAQGLIHHNSSVNVQIHNLIRASLTDKDHPGREVEVIDFINQLEID